jgi:hypothetical protein
VGALNAPVISHFVAARSFVTVLTGL